MEVVDSSIEHRIAARLKTLRAQRGLTLDELATRSGVSRSMISLIERAESSPTANTLDRLAASLGVTLASLFAEEERVDAAPLTRRADQPVWRDPDTGYLRRNLSPSASLSPIELVEIVLPPGAQVAYDSGSRAAPVDQQVWILEGTVEITVGADAFHLTTGDCLAMRVDRPTGFRNPGGEPARYLVALIVSASPDGPKRKKSI